MEQPQNVVALSSGGRPLGIIPKTLQEVEALAKFMLDSQYAPGGMDTLPKIVIGILHCLELGLSPMQGLSGIAVINGRPSIYGDTAWGLVLASGLVEEHEELMEGEGESWVAVCKMRRKGRKDVVERRFSALDAKRARLWDEREVTKRRSRFDRNKTYDAPNDSPWFKYPGRMLMWRARHRCISDLFADVTKGFPVWDRDEARMVEAEFTEVPEPRAVQLADLPDLSDLEPKPQTKWDAWLRSAGEDMLAAPDAAEVRGAHVDALREGGIDNIPREYVERLTSLRDKRLAVLAEAERGMPEKAPEKPQDGQEGPQATQAAPEPENAPVATLEALEPLVEEEPPAELEGPPFEALSYEDAQAMLHKQRTVADVQACYEHLKGLGFSTDALEALHKYANKRARLLRQVKT